MVSPEAFLVVFVLSSKGLFLCMHITTVSFVVSKFLHLIGEIGLH